MPINAFGNSMNTKTNVGSNARNNTNVRTTTDGGDDGKKTGTADQLPGYTAPQASSTMTMDSFMRLLATQLQNQDPSNPMTNAEMMGQLTSMATVQAMNTSMELSSTQYALSMMGKKVTLATYDEVDKEMVYKEGVVTGIDLANMSLFIEGDKVAYGLGNIMSVGDIPKKEEDTKPGDGDENKPSGGNDNTPGTGDDDKTGGSKATRSVSNYSGQIPSDKQASLDAAGQPDTRKNVETAGQGVGQTGPGVGIKTPSNVSGPGGVG